MAFISKASVREKVRKESGFEHEENMRNFSVDSLLTEKRAFQTGGYDIFLSHSFADAIEIEGLRLLLVEAGYSVYVDWIDDPELDRNAITEENARKIRERMRTCKSILYAISSNSRESVWMPWELGFMDSETGSRVAIVPIVEENQSVGNFAGQEYLGLYPYLDRTTTRFYIQRGGQYVRIERWMEGANPGD